MSDDKKPTKLGIFKFVAQQVKPQSLERWTPSAARSTMAKTLRQQFTAAVTASGGEPSYPGLQRQADIISDLYLTIAMIIDHFQEWPTKAQSAMKPQIA